MVGARDEKKNLLRSKILKSAREVFLAQGYDQTTIEQIAKNAGVGLGTAYNYFSSKEELFLLVMADEFIANAGDNILEYREIDADIAEITLEYLRKILRKMNFFNKKIGREIFIAAIGIMKSNPALLKTLINADYKAMDRIRDLLNKFKDRNLLADDFQVDQAVELIYGALMFQLMWFLFEEEMTYEQMIGKIESQIRFIFEGKCKKIVR